MANWRKYEDGRVAVNGDAVSMTSGLPVDVLAAAARGDLDLNLLARVALANQGLDAHGEWVGFQEAAEVHAIQVTEQEENGSRDDAGCWLLVRDVR